MHRCFFPIHHINATNTIFVPIKFLIQQLLIIFFPSLHYPFFLYYSSPIHPLHTSTRSNVFVQSNHLLSNSKQISLTIFCLRHVTVSLPLFTLGLSHYPLRPAFCQQVSLLVHLQDRFLPKLIRSSLIL